MDAEISAEKAARPPDPRRPATPSPAEIQTQLEKILANRLFVRSERLCRFLRLTVDRTLAGNSEQIKEYLLGREVFDRDEGYDPRIDSIVRVEARRLRTKLRQFYDGPGRADPVTIEFRSGTYIPVFRYRTEGPPEPPAAPPEPRTLNPRTVAVLPFVNISPDPDQDFFCDGITEEILNALTTVPELNVVARTSVFHFKGQNVDVREIGEQLQAGTVIEGSVRKAGSSLRISAKAIDASTGLLLWSDTYDREMADVFAVQSEIARAVAESLRVTLAPSETTVAALRSAGNLEAYTFYLKGRHYWNQMSQDGVQSALRQYSQAIALFPGYAPPYAALADAYAHLTVWGAIEPGEGAARAKQAALEALGLDENMADARATLGGILSLFEWRWQEGAQHLRRAIELQPSNVHAHEIQALHQIYRGAFQEALHSVERALSLDPLSSRGLRIKAWYHYYQKQYDQSIKILKDARPLDATNQETQCMLGWIYIRQSRFTEAVAQFMDVPDGPFTAIKLGGIGEAYAAAGENAKARDELIRLEALAQTGYVSPRSRTYIYAGLQDWDRVFGELSQACTDHCPWMSTLKCDPRFEAIHSDSRFRELLYRMNLI